MKLHNHIISNIHSILQVITLQVCLACQGSHMPQVKYVKYIITYTAEKNLPH